LLNDDPKLFEFSKFANP